MFYVQAVTGFFFCKKLATGDFAGTLLPQRKRPKGILKYEFQNDLLPFNFSVLSNVLINSFSFSIFKQKSLLNLLLKYDFQNDLLPPDFLVHSDILVNSSSCGIFNTSNW